MWVATNHRIFYELSDLQNFIVFETVRNAEVAKRFPDLGQVKWVPSMQFTLHPACTVIIKYQPDNPQDTDRIFFWMIRFFNVLIHDHNLYILVPSFPNSNLHSFLYMDTLPVVGTFVLFMIQFFTFIHILP